MKLHVHAILIFLIVVILFPTVWVVTTSLRRDEAAFSTDLFSSRLTLQNYVDLIVQEQNVPVLVKELQKLISRVSPYDRLTLAQARTKATELLRKMRNYLDESNKRNDSARKSYEALVKIFETNANRVKQSTLNDLRQIEKVLLKTLSELKIDKEELAFVLYEVLSKEKFNSQMEKILRSAVEEMVGFKIDDEQSYALAMNLLRQTHEELGGASLEELETLSARISSLRSEIESLRKTLQPLERSILEAQILLNGDVLTELRSLTTAVEALVKMKDSLARTTAKSVLPTDDTLFLKSLQNVASRLRNASLSLQGFEDLLEIGKTARHLSERLVELTNIEPRLKSLTTYSDMVRTYEEIRPRLERICDDLETLIGRYSDELSRLRELNSSILLKESELQRLSQRAEELQQKRQLLELRLAEERSWLQLILFEDTLKARLSSVEAIKSLSRTDLQRYSTVLTWLRNFANSYGRSDEVKESVQKAVSDLRWIEDYRTFTTRFENYSKNYEQIVKEFEQVMADFEKICDDLLVLSYSGTFVTSEHLTRLLDLVKLDFVNKVRADLAVVSRRAGSLMKLSLFSEAQKLFRDVDKHLFRIDQIWKEKMKHYFGRWVLNSIIVSTIVAIITTSICAAAAYPFSRMRFVGRRYGILSFLLIQMFPSVIFMIAIYNLLNFLGKFVPFLGVDTIGGLALAYLTNIAYNVYLIKGFYDLIPASLEEAAIVDGATRFQSFYMIVLPLARPILVVVFLLTFIGTFNEYVIARIVLQNVRNYTYALGLQSFAVGPYETEWGLFTAAALLGMLPMVILFLAMQRYLVSGLTRGAVKE
ncbi:MAG: Binding-protein-dependent transport systems inner membrane component [Thermotoga sp. 50_1627]|uniref:ABC transporter permease subunit n=1 Tax=Pseudothermotoga sp. TaxID=2033661 RepID=UPI00076D57ED|nr:MAG: Binding-protein-dependent transport systems inner membrane component [Thermotoga sp. 50_64]KUK24105.1 MAG: Binding-protein-dependent transport systems inner membrane component [Thermotoga sp. 50_1627]MBC7117043.1 ABC transporter permease subunit [Pseudothermotoga sp.]HBT40418.1 maltose ABC transporter permease [Pseudothermotoga sp.]HCO97821.1 maltose ABC transporter permease [Pseudothermotoga sp.]